MATASLSLLDMMDHAPAWLGCVVLATKRRIGPLPLFRSCTKLQHLVFCQQALQPMLSFRLQDPSLFGTPAHVRALALAEAHSTNVRLSIRAPSEDPNSLRMSFVAAFTSAATLHSQRTGQLQQPPVTYRLQCITSVHLQSAHLDSLLPDYLVLGCPNLSKLDVNHSTIVVPVAGAAHPTCTSLQELALNEVDISEADQHQFAQQLLNLPSLTAICLFEFGNADDYEEGGMIRAAFEQHSTQLKSLSVWIPDGNHDYLPWSPATHFPQLHSLELGNVEVTSVEQLQQLLDAAPSLTQLQVYSISGLETTLAHVPCSWQELRLTDVYVDQLAKLPLSSCTKLECAYDLSLSINDRKPTPEQITAGVAAAQAAGGLQFSYEAQVSLFSDDLLRLTAAAPLLQQLKECLGVEVYKSGAGGVWSAAAWSDALPLLTVLGQQLRCKQVDLWREWADIPGAFAQLPQLLPHVEGFRGSGTPAAELVEMCRTATRPFTLCIYAAAPGLKDQLQAAMQEAGHQLVTLDISVPP